MERNILNYFANTNGENIHSKGKVATNILLENLDCKPDEIILEFGFGTAATLVNFASTYKESTFFGIETNPIMYKKGVKRTRFCLQKKVNLILNTNPNLLPYPDSFFDKVYAESVLAIQEGENLSTILTEIHRILKPNGTFIINEGIWINTISKEKMNTINDFCKLNFGIIQSNSDYPFTSDWKKLFTAKGFDIEFIKTIEEIENNNKPYQLASNNFLSKLFSFYGKIQSKINPELNSSFLKFKKEIKKLSEEGKYMDGYIIKSIAVK